MERTRAKASKIIVISAALLFLLLLFSAVSFADTAVGKVTNLSGPLFAKKADGAMRVLSIHSIVEQGDTLVTEKKTYAQIKFTDNSVMNMRPGTQFRISQYVFDQAKPAEDKAVFNMMRGGMRALTGLIGKRGDPNSYKLVTETAVAGVRGTIYEVRICEDNCGSIANGLYLFVLEGIINISNTAGLQDVSAGQYVYVRSADSAPRILPGNPGLDFTLPAFLGDAKEDNVKKGDGGCEVR